MEESILTVWTGKTNLGLLAIMFALALSGLHLIYRDSVKTARSAPSASKIPFGRPLSVTLYEYPFHYRPVPSYLFRQNSLSRGTRNILIFEFHANRVPGLDLVINIIWHMGNYTFLEFTAGLLDKTPGRTATLDIMGTRLVLTDRQENITAVMLSQVHIISSSQLCRLAPLLFPSAAQK